MLQKRTYFYKIIGCTLIPLLAYISIYKPKEQFNALITIGLVVIYVIGLRIVKKKYDFEFPFWVEISSVLFLLGSLLLGGVLGFYTSISWWDAWLHFSSGGLLIYMIMSIFSYFLFKGKKNVQIHCLFLCISALVLSIGVGGVWEICEYITDDITGSNTQRHSVYDKVKKEHIPHVGHRALEDTMTDLILASAGASVVIFFDYHGLKKRYCNSEKSAENCCQI